MQKQTVYLSMFVTFIAGANCDGDPREASTPTGQSALSVSTSRSKRYEGRDFYDTDRFDDKNVGRSCGFVRARKGAITSGTTRIALSEVSFPLQTLSSTSVRDIVLTRKDPDRSLFELPVFIADINDDDRQLSLAVYLNRLTLEPEIMLVIFPGSVIVCQGLEPSAA